MTKTKLSLFWGVAWLIALLTGDSAVAAGGKIGDDILIPAGGLPEVASVDYVNSGLVQKASAAIVAALQIEKMNVVTGATNGNVAVFNSSGQVVDGGAALSGKEPAITAGTTGQYWRGDKSWQTLNNSAVGLGNVQNVDQTNGSNITSGTVAYARLPVGTTANTVAAGDAVAGKMNKVSGAGEGNIAVFDGAGQVVDTEVPLADLINDIAADLTSKMGIVSGATSGNVAVFGNSGQVVDSGASLSGKMNTVTSATNGNVAVFNGAGQVVDGGALPNLSTVNAHLSNTSNPHSVTKAQVGLGNVQNVDQTNGSNITSGTVGAAYLPVGTTSGKVAAGDDSRFDTIPTSAPGSVPESGRSFIWVEP